MKKLIPITILITLLVSSCVKYPYADFYASDVLVETYQIIHFNNNSNYYDNVEWSFGDGSYSTLANPSHHYSHPGIYTVTLTVIGHNGHTDYSSITIEVLRQTTLEITVLEYYNEYPVEDASIILYPSLYDWDHMTNPIENGDGEVLEAFTNSQGIATFTGLNPVSYWVDVWHDYYNNYALAEDDEDFIRTLPLEPNMINTFIAYVDYIESKSKQEGREISKFKIVKLERVYKEKTESK
ncbi:MAG: PKD domain-containing protein [Bacteroidales bacterium]|nr:PKD domain-containing protein [Bacteroidales bacterium]